MEDEKRVNPDRLLLLHPGEVLPWLRRQLRLNQRAFAAWLGVPESAVARWERRDSDIPSVYSLRLVPLVTRYLATEKGRDLLLTLGKGRDRDG